MQNNKNTLFGIVGAAGMAIFGSVLFHYYSKKQEQEQKSTKVVPSVLIDATTLAQFLKDLKSQSYPHFFLVAGIIKQVQNDLRKPEEIESIKEKIVPEVEKLFNKKQSMVIAKYPYTIEQMQDNLHFSDDPRVQRLHKEYIHLFTDAMNGEFPQIDIEEQTIEYYDRNKLIEMTQQVLVESVKIIKDAMETVDSRYGKEFEIAVEKPEFIKVLHELNFVGRKREVYERFNLTQFEKECDGVGEPTSPSEVFSKLTQHHKNQNQKFKSLLTELENAYEAIIKGLMNRTLGDVEDALGKVDIESIKQKYI